MSADRLPFDEIFLKEKLKSDPTTWETRRQLAHGLYDKQAYEEAAEIIWTTDQIPSTDLDLAFAIRILAKAQPRRAIRLLTAVLELNQGKAVQNMAMANALLHHGMVLQAARFYGAALEADPTLVNPDLEHFVLWSDDECTMWDLFDKNRPKLGQLPWMLRDPKEALRLTSRISLHTTPIYVPELPKVHGEDLKHDLYEQEAKHQAKITPPPAVTIPIDRVDPKDRLYDETYGATVVNSTPVAEPVEPFAAEVPAAPPFMPVVEAPPAPVAPPTLVAPPAPVAPSAPETITSKVVFPQTVGSSTRITLSARLTPLTSVQPVESDEPVETFPAKVIFPDSSRPVAPAASLTPVAPALPPLSVDSLATTPIPVATLITPAAPPEASAAPDVSPFFEDPTPPPAEAPLPAVVPFFADPTPPPVDTPPPSILPFFADITPKSQGAPPKAVSFLGDERLTGSVKLPPPAAVPGFTAPAPAMEEPAYEEPAEVETAEVETAEVETAEVVVEAAAQEKPSIPDALPISQSSVPTTLLHVKWSTSPARPGGGPAPAPSRPPVAPPRPFAPGAGPAPLPFAPAPAPLPEIAEQEAPVPMAPPAFAPAANLPPTGAPMGNPTGPPTRPLIPIAPPTTGVPVPTGVPTRVLLPSGTPPANPTGAPTRVLLPSGAPPANAEGIPARRLLFTPPTQAQPPAGSDGQ